MKGKAVASAAFDTLAIPSYAGIQPVTTRYQRRTQFQYALLVTLGLTGFYTSQNARLRVAGLSCLFPGAGFVAVGGISGAIGLIISLAFVPLCLFAWFGAGGLAFVLANWIFPGMIATVMAGKSVWEPAGPIVILTSFATVATLVVGGQRRHNRALKLRDERNAILEKDKATQATVAEKKVTQSEERELSVEDLRMFQHYVQVAHQADEDWSNYTRIDQFQTSALRYQIYGLQWLLAYVQKYYMPNFNGYVKTGQENLIEKSTTQDVMNFWKWESLWGKFTLDWDPVVRDNIMVTGYILLCLGLYEKLTGDKRYRKKDSLLFRITKRARYHHNTDSIFDAVMKNWQSCSYCLYPCEPNWIYTLCNLVGMQGALAYESCENTGRVMPLLSKQYHRAFEEDFMNADGSIVTLRSAITGFPVIGLAGVIGDVSGALTCAAAMPNLARRLWLVSRIAHVRKSKSGKYTLENLVGADNMDVGNYKAGTGFAFATFAQCASEFGDKELARDLLEEVSKMHPISKVPGGKGSLTNEGISMIGAMLIFRSRIGREGEWANLINAPPDVEALAAPKLDRVPFPEVMVARCHPVRQTGLVFVLRALESSRSVTVDLVDLKAGASYQLISKTTDGRQSILFDGIKPDVDGVAKVTLQVGDRSEFEIRIVE